MELLPCNKDTHKYTNTVENKRHIIRLQFSSAIHTLFCAQLCCTIFFTVNAKVFMIFLGIPFLVIFILFC